LRPQVTRLLYRRSPASDGYFVMRMMCLQNT